MITPTYDQIRKAYKKFNYPFYTNRYDLNLFAIRNKSTEADIWDDTIGYAYLDENYYQRTFLCVATTHPGLYYLQNPINPKGAAILKNGHYPQCYALGKHKGYTALVQIAPMTYIRDANKDNKLDWDALTETVENAATNLHRALPEGMATTIGKFSAGCQVVQAAIDHDYLLDLDRVQQKTIGSDKLSYSIFWESDFTP